MSATVAAAVLSDPSVQIPQLGASLDADLHVVPGARALVVFAYESRSDRHSDRNQHLAAQLQQTELATLVPDLLTPEEEAIEARSEGLRFDIPLLVDRLLAVRDWVARDWSTQDLPVAYLGCGTGAAAALAAAALRPRDVFAVVCAGRPDLAWDLLPNVRAATLLMVGDHDCVVEALSRQALERLRCPSEIKVLPGANQFAENPAALDDVARLAAAWFLRYLPAS
jgi:dienelactone hydrolase